MSSVKTPPPPDNRLSFSLAGADDQQDADSDGVRDACDNGPLTYNPREWRPGADSRCAAYNTCGDFPLSAER
jgi:hypothetical protein